MASANAFPVATRSRRARTGSGADVKARDARDVATGTGGNVAADGNTVRAFHAPHVYGSRYRCNYCARDISTGTRISCVRCKDFDLCISCFAVGATLYPHEPTHPYRVVEHVTAAVFAADWGADEELRLLEGLEVYGPGNFASVAEYVGTKSRVRCEQHYLEVYLNAADTAPLPNMRRMASGAATAATAGNAAANTVTTSTAAGGVAARSATRHAAAPVAPAGSPRASQVAREMALINAAASNMAPDLLRAGMRFAAVADGRAPPSPTASEQRCGSVDASSDAAGESLVGSASPTSSAEAASSAGESDGWSARHEAAGDSSASSTVRGHRRRRRRQCGRPLYGRRKQRRLQLSESAGAAPDLQPVPTAAEADSGTMDVPGVQVSPPERQRRGTLSGYMPKRHDFDVEPFMNDAETVIADLSITEEDTAEERERKVQLLQIYTRWLEERALRKTVVQQRGLTDLSATRTRLKAESPLEREVEWMLLPLARLAQADNDGGGAAHDVWVSQTVHELRIAEEVHRMIQALQDGAHTVDDWRRWETEVARRYGGNETGPAADALPPTALAEMMASRMGGDARGEEVGEGEKSGAASRAPTRGKVGGGRRTAVSREGNADAPAPVPLTSMRPSRFTWLNGNDADQVRYWDAIYRRTSRAVPRGVDARGTAHRRHILYVKDMPGVECLDANERQLCALMRITPQRFLEWRALVTRKAAIAAAPADGGQVAKRRDGRGRTRRSPRHAAANATSTTADPLRVAIDVTLTGDGRTDT